MADVFDEISDDLRREKLNQFWKENGSWIIGGAIAAVLLTGFLTFWRQWEYRRDAAATLELTHLAATPANLPQLEKFAEKADKSHAMMARFAAAEQRLEHKEKDKAIAIYNAIAATPRLDKTWRDLAHVLSISQRLDQDPPAALEKELAGLSGDDNTWRFTARELEALLAARQGQMQKAASILAKITADPQAPQEARQRAYTLRELYAADIKAGSKS
jgi:hypothetical protein